MSELHLFDFDGTLFKSPDRPDWWGPKTWLVDPASLGPPCVPLKPGSDWWIGSSVRDAKRSISDSDVWAILCTGRADMGSLRYRVAELLKQKGLNFDEVFLNPTNNTETYKIQVMLKILQKHPHIDTVQIWEDHPGHLPKFVKAIEATGRTCIPHLIKSTKHEVVCVQEDMEKLVAEGWSKWRKAMKNKVSLSDRLIAKWKKANPKAKVKADPKDIQSVRKLMNPDYYVASTRKARYMARVIDDIATVLRLADAAVHWGQIEFLDIFTDRAKVLITQAPKSATKVAVLHLAKDSKAQEYVKDKAEELKEKGYDDDKAFAVAWSIYCKYKSKDIPDSEGHCKKSPSEYFPNKKASTNTERDFYKATDGNWYVDNEDYNEDEDGEQIEGDMTSYGPFPSFEAADKYMSRNFANSGGYGEDDSGRMKPPRRPTKPRRSASPSSVGASMGFPVDVPSSQREIMMNTMTQRVAARHLRRTAGKIPSKAPRDVKQVAKAWQENAMEAAEAGIAEDGETGSEARGTRSFWKDRLYVSEMDSDKGSRWLISDNYERAATMVYYPDSDEWYYMPMYGSEKLMRGGTREALANAQIIWTG